MGWNYRGRVQREQQVTEHTYTKASTISTATMKSSLKQKTQSRCGSPEGSPGGWGCTKHHVQRSWGPALQSSPLQGCQGQRARWSPAHTGNHTHHQTCRQKFGDTFSFSCFSLFIIIFYIVCQYWRHQNNKITYSVEYILYIINVLYFRLLTVATSSAHFQLSVNKF